MVDVGHARLTRTLEATNAPRSICIREAEEVILLLIYAKSAIDNIKGSVLKEIRRALEE